MKKTLNIGLIFLLSIAIQAQDKKITLNDIWEDYHFYPKSINGLQSMKNGTTFTKIDKFDGGKKINQYSYLSGKKIKTIISSENLDIDISNYTFSPDEQKILFATQTENIYRYSSRSVYFIYNLKSKKITKLHDDKVRYASFSNDGNKIAYVNNNNLFIKNLTTDNITQVTYDGKLNHIINGATDWVYEEEFGLVKGFFWSPDGTKIAYYKFDESNVKEFGMATYNNELYPGIYEFKYPKAGEENSKVSIHIFNLKDSSNVVLNSTSDYEYVPRINWTKNSDQLYTIGMNRHQNKLDFILNDLNSSESRILFSETDPYYIDIHDNTTFIDDKSMIWTSEKSGYNHIYRVDLTTGIWNQITRGKWEVTDFHGVDKYGLIFYSSNENGSINKDLFKIKLDGKQKVQLTKKIGNHNTNFSEGLKYYINNFSSANTTPYYTLHNSKGRLIRVLEENQKLNEVISTYQITPKEFLTVKTSDTVELNAWIIKPPNFDPNKKYPLFMFLYGGPGSQQVLNSFGWFNYFWHQHLAQQGYIVACVDNRGTGGKGAEFKKMTYLQLGKYETIDQIQACKYFGNLPYVDRERIGIQGWSYGGYMSSLAITKGAEYFKMAIAVAPVTNWRYYDNIYTERFMRTPQENPNGYDDNSPINHVDKLQGNYLLIHGTGDDNVHVQNTYEMAASLIKANKQFDLFIYPDKNHGIYGGNTRLHLYQMMTDYILENL